MDTDTNKDLLQNGEMDTDTHKDLLQNGDVDTDTNKDLFTEQRGGHRHQQGLVYRTARWTRTLTRTCLQNGEVDTDEFLRGVETACKGKAYKDLPAAFKFFIEAQFRTIDVDGEMI